MRGQILELERSIPRQVFEHGTSPDEVSSYLTRIMPIFEQAAPREDYKFGKEILCKEVQKGSRLRNMERSFLGLFQEQQIQVFFKVIEDDKFALLFKYQSSCALRVGELL